MNSTSFFTAIISSIFLTLMPFVASAVGGSNGGGGDALLCNKAVFFADTYSAKDSAKFKFLSDLYETRKEFVEASLIHLLKKAESSAGIVLQNLLLSKTGSGSLILMPVSDVPELEDDNLSVPQGCTKKQLAIQTIAMDDKGQLQSTVTYNQDLYAKLSPLEALLFKTHEVLIRQRLIKPTWNPDSNTSNIRQVVELLSDTMSQVLNYYQDKAPADIDAALLSFHEPVKKFYELQSAFQTAMNMQADTTLANNYYAYVNELCKSEGASKYKRYEEDCIAQSRLTGSWLTCTMYGVSGSTLVLNEISPNAVLLEQTEARGLERGKFILRWTTADNSEIAYAQCERKNLSKAVFKQDTNNTNNNGR